MGTLGPFEAKETEQKTHSTIGSALLGIEPNVRYNEPHRETAKDCEMMIWFAWT